MRDIRFRAWDIIAKQYFHHDELILDGALKEYNECSMILEQYTGLNDRFGKEIYENDRVMILYTDWPSKPESDTRTLDEYLDSISNIGIIEYSNEDGCAGYIVRYSDGNTSSIAPGKFGRITVIDNIHEEVIDARD